MRLDDCFFSPLACDQYFPARSRIAETSPPSCFSHRIIHILGVRTTGPSNFRRKADFFPAPNLLGFSLSLFT